MGQRLATDYVKTCLQLTEAEMTKFIQLFAEHEIVSQAKVYENGNQEVAFHDESGREIVLSFERKSGKYVCEGSCRISSPRLVNFMRKAVTAFKGDAVVHRIYPTYKIVYSYVKGSVVKITEVKAQQEKIIYEFKDTLGGFEQLFQSNKVEREIDEIQHRINVLLDQRNQTLLPEVSESIDEHLRQLSHQLFVLEA